MLRWEGSQLRLDGISSDHDFVPGFGIRRTQRLSRGDLFFGQGDRQRGLGLPAALHVLQTEDGTAIDFEAYEASLPESDSGPCLRGRLYSQSAEDTALPIVWHYGGTAAEAQRRQATLGLVAGVYIAETEEVYELGGGGAPWYLHPLPRLVLTPKDRAADNTDPDQSMAHLLRRFVHRFTTSPQKLLPKIAVATGFLYQKGLESLLALLKNPQIEELRLLFSGRADKQIIALMEEYFLQPLDQRDEPESVQLFHEAMSSGRMEVRVYPHAFLHAKLFLGWEYIADDGLPEGAAVVGSSNITGAGLHHAGNLELNVHLNDSHTLASLKRWFEARWEEGEEPQPQLMEALEQRRQRRQPPSFAIEGLREVWEAGARSRLAPAGEYLDFLARLYRQRIGLTRIDLEQPPFPHDDVRQITPAPEQESGVLALAQRLLQLRFAFLADSVGLGKTITSLGTAWYLYRLQESQRIVVIAPRKLFHQWESDRQQLRMPDGIVTYINRHVLERKSEEDALAALAPFDLILVEEAHQTLRARKNKLWSHLRAHLRKKLKTRLLLISATPWNNSREDIFNYISLAWHDGSLALGEHFPTTMLQPVKRHIEYFRGRLGPAARIFSSLPLQEYRAIFGETFVQRTRHRIAKLYASQHDFPERKIQPYPLPASPEHDRFFGHLEQSLEQLTIPYREPFRALQRAVAATQAKLPEELQDVPDSNLHRSFLIQLYKRAESSILALAISLANVVRRLEAFEQQLVEIVYQSKQPRDDLQAWMEEQYLRLQHDISTSQELSLLEQDLLSPAEKARFGSLKKLFDQLDDESVKDAVRHLIQHEIASDQTQLKGLQQQLQLSLEVSSPKGLLATETLKLCHEKGRKLVLIAGYTDTAIAAFVHAINAVPEARIGLAVGGNEGWIYDPKDHRPSPFDQQDWDTALAAQDGIARRKQLLQQRAATMNRRDVLRAFCPKAQKTTAHALEKLGGEIDFLIGSEAISVGQNLQDATALFQLDMPWNPMVIEQRIGRIDRRGGGRRQDPNDPTSPKIVDVYYCWSHAAIENEIALRDKLKDKTAGAIQDTRFDELLLYELRDKIEAVRNASGEFPQDADHREELAAFLKQRQTELLDERTRPAEISEDVGAIMEGIRHLATWSEAQQLDLDVPPQPVVACGVAAEGPQSPMSWSLTLALQPKDHRDRPLGPTLYESLLFSPQSHPLPQTDLEAVVLGLHDAASQQRHRAGTRLSPLAWEQTLLALEQQLQAFAQQYLDQHNQRIAQSAQQPTKALDVTSKFRVACDKARKALQMELKGNPYYKTPEGRQAIEPIRDRLKFLLQQLTPERCHRLVQDQESELRSLEGSLQLVITLPRKILQDEFDQGFLDLVGPLWQERQEAQFASSELLPAVQARVAQQDGGDSPHPEAQIELSHDRPGFDRVQDAARAAEGRWSSLDIRLIAAAVTS